MRERKGAEEMKENFSNEILYYTFPELEQYDFMRHAFSSREGGVSQGYYSSMNLGINTPDERTNVEENYRLFCAATGFDVERIVLAQLQHGANVRVVTDKDAGKGLWKPFDYENIDGLVTNEPNLILTATFADCVPVFFVDPVKKAVGIAHSGWRGCVKEISAKMIHTMERAYESDAGDILAAIGPSIGGCCFEVSEDTYYDFTDMPYFSEDWCYLNSQGNYEIDLWKVIRATLIENGVTEEHITISGLCTKCNPDIFFSHRASKGKRGTMAGMIALR